MEANGTQHRGNTITDLMATVDKLTYASYRANRLRSPEVLPERWALLPCFALIDELEARFQKEIQRGEN
jgi:hypothetical protein